MPLGRGTEPPRPEGGTPETPGRVQPHSLLCESVTSGDLHRREPCFISLGEGPALRCPRPSLGHPETRTILRGKGDASGALGDHRPSAGGRAHRRLPRQMTYLCATPCSMRRGGGPGSGLLPRSPPVRFSRLERSHHPRVSGRCCGLVHLRSMVSVIMLPRYRLYPAAIVIE